MYWIVGCPPGGSAGTSFCSGTEISISRLAISVSSKDSVVFQSDGLDAGFGDDVAPFRHLVVDALSHAFRSVGEDFEAIVAQLLRDLWPFQNFDRLCR